MITGKISRVEVIWWLVVGIQLGGNSVDGGGKTLMVTHLREPRMSYIAKIIEEKKEKSVATPAPAQAADEDDESDESEDDSSEHTREEEEKVVGIPRKKPEANGTLGRGFKIGRGKYVAQRSAKEGNKGRNWYVYKSDGRSMGTLVTEIPPGGGGKTGTGGSKKPGKGGGGHGGGGGKPGIGLKPFKVVRARPGDQVDPSGYNFFQVKPKSRFGWLWMSRIKPGDRLKGREGEKPDKDDRGADLDDSDPASLYDWEFRRFDRACLFLEYNQRKTDAKIPLVSEEIKRLVDLQNEKLARKFIDWQFVNPETSEEIALGGKGQDHPHRLTFKFLQGIVSIFTQKICKNATSYVKASAASAPFGEAQKAILTGTADAPPSAPETDEGDGGSPFLPTIFVDNLFNLFLILRNMTVSDNVKDYPSKEDEELIFDKLLKECNDTGTSIPWFAHSCGDQLLSYDNYKNYACTPFMEYDFNVRKYDPILDTLWHMFNAVHSYCFQHFLVNPRLWHKFSLIIANSFTPEMRLRWKASVASETFYMRLLGPDYATHLDTINRCTFAATQRSDAPLLLPRFDTLSMTTFGGMEE